MAGITVSFQSDHLIDFGSTMEYQGRAWQMPMQLPQHPAAVSSRQQLSAVAKRWSMSPFWASARPSSRGAALEGKRNDVGEVPLPRRFHWGIDFCWNLPCLKIYFWTWITSWYTGLLLGRGHRMRWHPLKARCSGSALNDSAGWNRCRWSSFATWQAREKRITPQQKSLQRTLAILISENWHSTHTSENVQANLDSPTSFHD